MKKNPFDEYIKALSAISINEEFNLFKNAWESSSKIIILGNGGSNAVASHISQDYVKFHNKKSLVFSDPSMLTCFINDFGMDKAFQKFLEFHADQDTLVILISSSGNSMNVFNCALHCKSSKIQFILLSGFEQVTIVGASSVYIFTTYRIFVSTII